VLCWVVCSAGCVSDLRALWNWNVKQAFVWIAVDFPTPSRVSSTTTHSNHTHRLTYQHSSVLLRSLCCRVGCRA